MDVITDPTTNAAFLIFSAVSPLLIAFVKQSGWSSQTNALIAFACYILVGIGAALVSGIPLNLENAVQLVTLATVVGSAAYKLLWDNIGTANGGASLDDRLTSGTSVVR